MSTALIGLKKQQMWSNDSKGVRWGGTTLTRERVGSGTSCTIHTHHTDYARSTRSTLTHYIRRTFCTHSPQLAHIKRAKPITSRISNPLIGLFFIQREGLERQGMKELERTGRSSCNAINERSMKVSARTE